MYNTITGMTGKGYADAEEFETMKGMVLEDAWNGVEMGFTVGWIKCGYRTAQINREQAIKLYNLCMSVNSEWGMMIPEGGE